MCLQLCTQLLRPGHSSIIWKILRRAANTTIRELQEVAKGCTWLIHYQRLFDAHFSLCKLILNDCVALIVRIGKQFANECSFASSEETCKQINLSLLRIILLHLLLLPIMIDQILVEPINKWWLKVNIKLSKPSSKMTIKQFIAASETTVTYSSSNPTPSPRVDLPRMKYKPIKKWNSQHYMASQNSNRLLKNKEERI